MSNVKLSSYTGMASLNLVYGVRGWVLTGSDNHF